MKKQLFIGIFIGSACLYWAFRGLDFSSIAQSIRAADGRWLAAAIGGYVLAYVFRTIRWKILLSPVSPVSFRTLLPVLVIGFFANNFLPFRMGELIRAHLAGRKLHISRASSLGSIVIERITDSISFLMVFAFAVLFFPFPARIRAAAGFMGVTMATVIVLILVASRFQPFCQEKMTRLPIPELWKQKLLRGFEKFVHGLSGLNHGPTMIRAMGLSLLVWCVEGSFIYLIARAFPVTLGYPQAFVVLFFLGLSVALPQAPGYVGTMELFGSTALAMLGIPKDQGLSIILTLHGMQFIFLLVAGFWALGHEGMSVSSLTESSKQ